MANKQVIMPGIGTVNLYKRKGSRSIKLSVTATGAVRVTMPYWLPYEAGLVFVRSRKDWIAEHTASLDNLLVSGQTVGKSHRLVFEKSPTATKVATRVTATAIYITHPVTRTYNDDSVQAAAQRASIRALRAQAEDLLPDRLRELAQQHGFNYRSVQVKQLSGRWGSCDSHQNIIFNLFLMQLPWTLIDYVILHELTHTQVMRHGPEFWRAMARVLPDVQVRRRAMRQHKPAVS
jgi:predicted metal-dependent hydrolase